MRKRNILKASTLLLILFLWNKNVQEVRAEETQNFSTFGLGGMSEALDKFYDDILNESGISVGNVDTTIYINGEKVETVNTYIPQLDGKALVDVIDYLNIRKKASTESAVVGRLYKYGAVTVVDTKGEWSKITSGDVTGYIKTEFLKSDEDALALAKEYYTLYAEATCTTLNVRSGKGEDFSIQTQVPLGEKLAVEEVYDQWVEVSMELDTDKKSYVSKEYVKFIYEFEEALTMKEVKQQEEAFAQAQKNQMKTSSNSSVHNTTKSSAIVNNNVSSSQSNSTSISNMIWPLPADHNIYSKFGYRVAPTAGASTYHKGLDIGGPSGAAIVAVLSGTVTTAGYSSTSGNYVVIDHGNGVQTRYLHCSALYVSAGQRVSQGQTIAAVGSTGISTSAHLHFSVVVNGSYVDPYPYLKAVQ